MEGQTTATRSILLVANNDKNKSETKKNSMVTQNRSNRLRIHKTDYL